MSRDAQNKLEACSILYIHMYDIRYEVMKDKERREAQTKEEAKHSSSLSEAQADTMMLQGRKKKRRRT